MVYYRFTNMERMVKSTAGGGALGRALLDSARGPCRVLPIPDREAPAPQCDALGAAGCAGEPSGSGLAFCGNAQ